MTYGDGSGNARPLVEIDVAGHEMSHGVSGALVGWQENGETGGMNEGTSDIFGTLGEFYANNAQDTPDYTMGELININGDNKPLRYMYNPSLDGRSPNCYTSSNGSLDPHYSLGPLTHWFFLLAVGSGDHGYGNSPTCNSTTLTGIGNDKSAKIWYRALASYASSSENYSRARTDSLKAAADLYGTHCTEYNAVNAAWAAVSVTAMANAQEGDDRMTDVELVVTSTLLLIAGHETTANYLGNSVLALLRHPEEMARLAGRPEVTAAEADELLRYDPPGQLASRFAREDVELDGVQISKGDVLLPLLGAANRDPERFAEPDRLDLTRRNVRHLSFGYGIHLCLGAQLARKETRIALRRLLDRAPGLEVAGDL